MNIIMALLQLIKIFSSLSDLHKLACFRVMIVEAYASKNKTMAYYGTNEYKIAHFPLNFQLVKNSEFFNASRLAESINLWFQIMPRDATPNWVVRFYLKIYSTYYVRGVHSILKFRHCRQRC